MFKIGEIVRLKSGGPEMTVSDESYADRRELVHVLWFSDKIERDVFHKDCLVKVAPNES